MNEEAGPAEGILNVLSVHLVTPLAVIAGLTIALLGSARRLRRQLADVLPEQLSEASGRGQEGGPCSRLKGGGKRLLLLITAICLAFLGWSAMRRVEWHGEQVGLREPNVIMMLVSFGKGLAIWSAVAAGLAMILLLLVQIELLRMGAIAARKRMSFSDRYNTSRQAAREP
jgi:hypothetical protein